MPSKSDPRRDTRDEVRKLHAEQGIGRGGSLTVSQVARRLRITPARVYQHLAALKEEAKA